MELIRKVFIIMPFRQTSRSHTEDYWTDLYLHLLKPCIERPDLPVHRSAPLRKDLLREIIKNLIFSKIVLADITDLNSNVMWELGVRQSFTNGTIVIAERGAEKPFDIITKGIIVYPKRSDPNYHSEIQKFEEKLKKAIADCENNPDACDSHILETISGRGTVYEIISLDESLRKLEALINEFESNIKLLLELDKAIEFNKKFANNTRGGGCDITNRFRKHSTELLLTTRYLPQTPDFYLHLQEYFDDLERLNSQIEAMTRDRKSAVAWFLMHRHQITNFTEILTKINKIKEEIQNKYSSNFLD
jgi:hypothetical protein